MSARLLVRPSDWCHSFSLKGRPRCSSPRTVSQTTSARKILKRLMLVTLPLSLFSQALHAQLTAEPSIRGQDRYFTVRDSIEMSRFDRTWRSPDVSPDKRHFSVVTSRG